MRRRSVLRSALGLAGTVGIGAIPAGGRPNDPSTDGRSWGYGPIRTRGVAGTADCRVSADGTVVYLAVGDGFVALSVPALSVLAAVRSIEADREGGPLTGVADVAVDGDQLLVPGPANPRPGRIAGFALFDVSDPAQPEQVTFYETSFPIHNAELADGRAYLTAGTDLVIVDVTDDDPVEIGRWSLADADRRWDDVATRLWVLHDLRIRGELAVLSQWDAGTWLVDVSAPDEVAVVGRVGGRLVDELTAIPSEDRRDEAIRLPGNHHSAALSEDGSVLAVGAEAFAVEGDVEDRGPGDIDCYDLTDPTAPAHLATIDAPRAANESRTGTWTTAHDFAFDGDRLLSAWYQGGVRIHDLSTPASPREIASWRQPGEIAFWTARPAVGDTFVASATSLPDDGLVEGLYLFPNRPGTQVDQPSLTASPMSTSTPSPPSPTDSSTKTGNAARSPGQSGFGQLGALAGFAGLAAWHRWRQRSSSR